MADMDATVHAWHRSGKQRANNKIVAYIGCRSIGVVSMRNIG